MALFPFFGLARLIAGSRRALRTLPEDHNKHSSKWYILWGEPPSTCYDSCWWGDDITNSIFPVGTDLERTFYANQGNLIRVVITWWANADTPGHNYSFDRLDTDLDLRIRAPNGQYVAWSLSNDNNYEMVEFLASQTGQYTVVVRKYRADEDSNYLGIALARIYRVHLPIVVRDYP